MATIGAIVEGNRGLVELLAAKCSCFADNSSHYRVQLLTQTPRCALQGFRLLLNDVPVSVEERLAAVKQASLPVQIFCEGGVDTLPANKETVARLHLALSLHEAGAPWERKEISLRQQGLTYIADLVLLHTHVDVMSCTIIFSLLWWACRRGTPSTTCAFARWTCLVTSSQRSRAKRWATCSPCNT